MLLKGLRKSRGYCFITLLFALSVSACGPDIDTIGELDKFSDRTEEILEKDRELAEEYGALLDKINRTLEETNSAKAVVEAGLYDQLADNMDAALKISKQYQKELEEFFSQLDEDSPCYFPEIAENLKAAIKEKQAYADALNELQGAEIEEGNAVLLGVNATPNSFAAGMSNMVEMIKICQVPAAMGMTKSELEARSER